MRRFSVTGLLRELDDRVHRAYPRIIVEAEVGQITQPSSGHAYLQLREPGARGTADTLSGVCFRNEWRSLRHRPKEGDRVACRGRLGVFTRRSQVQLQIYDIEPLGRGDLARRIAERIARLQAEGLLDPSRKRPLPPQPRTIGVVASLTGAALQDFLRVSGERSRATRILVAPCLTQGPEAPSSVVRAVELLLEDGRAEIVVITRGGGSAEDLLAYQDEQLARYLAHVPVPVVTAVGHEVDTTLVDLVADVAVPTPTAAAVRTVPDDRQRIRQVDEQATALLAATRRILTARRRDLDALQARLRHPRERLADSRRRAQDLTARLHVAMGRQLAVDRARLAAASGRLDALSPLAVLTRGYAVVTGPNGVITRATEVAPGDRIDVRVAEGRFSAVVDQPSTNRSVPKIVPHSSS